MNEGGIFVNFRVGDEEYTAALVHDWMARYFGAQNVFRASTIEVGKEYEPAILAAVQRCAVLLALIGPRWVDKRDRDGVRCLDRPGDWVRREIAEAIRCGTTVVPVLIGAARMPAETDLPEGIRGLAGRQYRRWHYPSSDGDLSGLIEALVDAVPKLAQLRARQERSVAGELPAGRPGGIRVSQVTGHATGNANMVGVRDPARAVTDAIINQRAELVDGEATVTGYTNESP